MHRAATERYLYQGNHTSVRGEVEATRRFARGAWEVETRTRTVLTCTAEEFLIHAQLEAYEAGTRVYQASWDRAIPRDLL